MRLATKTPSFFVLVLGIGIVVGFSPPGTAFAADDPPAATAAPTAPSAITGKSPADVVKDAPKGSLKNPFNPSQEDNVAKGKELFQSYSCSGCHGGTGGGGMCPQINGDVWFYGMQDDTLFRLVTLGSVDLQKAGFDHLGGQGNPMPPFGGIIKSDEELWDIITWIRSIYKGDPKKKFW
jgi:mono/diheme cytochrome c family protein